MHEEQSPSAADSTRWRFFPEDTSSRARPVVCIDAVAVEDVEHVRDAFWPKLIEARPRIGRLSALRDFAVNLVRLFEMLVEPGFKLPWKTTAAVVFALAYFISSVDVIPDAIPVLGFVDDAFVVAEVLVMVGADLARFEKVRAARGSMGRRSA